jgi:glycerol-3-phosphate acyltransferase PlsY
MIFNIVVSGIIAVILGYLIGGIPSAYIVTRLVKGKDIREIGTGHTGVGNVGARNVFVNVGKIPGVIVGTFDILKGAGAVYLAGILLKRPDLTSDQLYMAVFFVLGAGLAAVIGHIWPVYLKFRGGAGLATSLGVLAVLLTQFLLFALIMAIVLIIVTRNAVLSVNLSLIIVPLWAWFYGWPWYQVVFPLIIMVVMLIHYLPNITTEVRKAGSFDQLMAGLLRRDTPKAKR